MVCLSQLFREIPTQKFITKNLPTSTKHNLPLKIVVLSLE
jgi:hypothetical protein